MGGNSGLQIKSAGFFPKAGRKSAEDYVSLVREYGVDISEHTSTVVDASLFEWADAIIIMDGKNYKLSLMQAPKVANKLIWLGGLCRDSSIEIQDPYNKPVDQQKIIIEQMVLSCESCIRMLGN